MTPLEGGQQKGLAYLKNLTLSCIFPYNVRLSGVRTGTESSGKSVFQHPPVEAFRRSPNLHDLLVTAKFPSNSANPQLPCGSFRCGKNCATCPYISHGLTTYTLFSNEETRPIKFNLTCETKAREAFLIQKGRTIDPDDLNIREETY